jgi:hypothetical protein
MTFPPQSVPAGAASTTGPARFAPTYPPYVYVACLAESEEVAGLLAVELERRGVPLLRHVSRPGAPLFDEDDPDLGGATAVLMVGGQAIAVDDSVERVLPYFSDRMFAVALGADGIEIGPGWVGIGTWAFGNWRGDPDRAQLDTVTQRLRVILGTELVKRSSSAHAVLTVAASRDNSPDAATAVLLEALAYRPQMGIGVGVTLLELLARQQNVSGMELLSRVGSLQANATQRQDVDLKPALKALLARAAACASRVTTSPTVHLRHLLAAAVIADTPPADASALAALGTDLVGLRALLLDAVRATRHGDRLPDWEELLAERLAGGFDSDLVDQTLPIPRDRDDLGNGAWAAMFASLIADEATPMPVSIGLFGEWGAGKSTFMGLLRGEIAAVCGRPGYVRDVVQIGFNAWHYADANLWASIGDEIFPALMGKLTPPESEQEQVKRRAAELRGKINDGLVAVSQLAARTKQAERQSERLAAEVTDAQQDKVAAWGLLGAALKSSESNGELEKAWRHLGISDQVAQGELFAGELDGIRQDRTVLRALLGRRLTLVMAVVCLAALLVTLAGAVTPVSWAPRLRDGGAISAITLVLTFALTLARITSQALAALRAAAAKAAEEKDQRIKAARIKLQEARERERANEAEMRQISADIAHDQRELADLAPGRRLYTFLAERAASADYAGHLGLVSTIRKDFQHLVRVLKEHRETGDPAEPRIDRIVLYIDDLDRCRPRQVVEVLQAVHLLLALDLFVVVVGVDPRWLIRSLREQYPGILDAESGREATAAGRDLAGAVPVDYLEKIFNIPFALSAFHSQQMEQLVRHLADEPAGQAIGVPQPQEGERDMAVAGEGPDEGASVLTAEPGSQVEAIQATGTGGVTGAAIGPRSQRLTVVELGFLGGLGPFIKTPRDAKRLFNIYRMLRATRDLSPVSRFLDGEYQAVAMLLAMLTLDAHVLGLALDAPPRSDQAVGGLTKRTAGDATWNEFAEGLTPKPATGTAAAHAWHNEVVGEIPAAELGGWQRMAEAVNVTRGLVKLEDLTAFRTWAPHIRRFSYTFGPQDSGTPDG